MKIQGLIFLILLLLLPHAQAECTIKKQWLNLDYDHQIDYQNQDVLTDFFLLVYSNSPNFCQYMTGQGKVAEVPFQCSSPNQFGWVVHGLWGQSKTAYIRGHKKKHPRFCQGDLEPLRLDLIKPYLCMSPGTRLLQGQWEKHGACDFSSAEKYFDQSKKLFQRYQVPPAHLNARKAVQWMKANNPILKNKWLHLTPFEFGICFNKSFEPISCPNKVRR